MASSSESSGDDASKRVFQELETYVSLDSVSELARPNERVLLEPPASNLRLFTTENAPIWKPALLGSAMFLGGSVLLRRYNQDPGLLRRRRLLLGTFSVIFPLQWHIQLATRQQLVAIQPGHPAYGAWQFTVAFGQATERGRERAEAIRTLRTVDVPPDKLLQAEKSLAELTTIYLHEERSQAKGLSSRLLRLSRSLWSSERQRALLLSLVFHDYMQAAGVKPYDQYLFATHACCVASMHQYHRYKSPSLDYLTGALTLGFVAHGPILSVVIGAIGLCSLTSWLALVGQEINFLYDVWQYQDVESMGRFWDMLPGGPLARNNNET